MHKGEIEKLKKEIKRLQKLAYRDELTGLYNRRGFKDAAGNVIAAVIGPRTNRLRNKRKSFLVQNFGLIIFDVDNFKKFNDVYGHLVGDVVLKNIGRIILKNVRDIDIVARWGGEELVIGLVGAAENDSFRAAEKIRRAIESGRFVHAGQRLKLTVSGGVADLVRIGNFADLFSAADKALYRAKKLGKNRIFRYSEL